MELLSLYALLGFMLASYSVIANDSVQTLGTFIASNSEKFKWYYLAGAASLVLCGTLTYGWYINGGDITFGRLNKIPWIELYNGIMRGNGNLISINKSWYSCIYFFSSVISICFGICIRKNVSEVYYGLRISGHCSLRCMDCYI